VQTITAKREKPHMVSAGRKSNGNPTFHRLSLQGLKNPLGPRALYLGDTLYRIHGTNRPGLESGGAVLAWLFFACTTRTSSSCTKKYKSERTSTSCLDMLADAS